MKIYNCFINNKWVKPHSGKWFYSENPANGEEWAKVSDCNSEDVNDAVKAAKDAFYEGEWSMISAAQRGRYLHRIGEVVTKYADRLGKVETKDNGKLPKNITPSLRQGQWLVDSWHYYGGMCDKFEGKLIPSEAPNIHNYMHWEPYGVVAQILPWNSPLGTLFWKLAPCLAAGNTVVLKPSEHASCSILELMEILIEAELPPGVINVVTGYGKSVGEPLIEHKDVRMVSFTGGTSGGRAVASIASKQTKPIVMELGGKSPQIILPDADIDLAVNGVVSGIFPAGGQSCISGSRILIHKSIFKEVTKKLLTISKKAVVGDPLDPKTHIGPIANKNHYENILKNISKATEDGCEIILDGRTHKKDKGYFVGPTIFSNVPNSSFLAQNEIFGPVISTEPWEDDSEVIKKANDTIYGLAAGIWTKDTIKGMRLANKIESGTVYINNYFNAATQSPVGGYKQSGYGRENGWEGMRCFMQTKSVWLSTKPSEPDPFL